MSPFGDGLSSGFLSTPSARRATDASPTWEDITQFLSTPSARRATDDVLVEFRDGSKFLSTPSARRATSICKLIRTELEFLSTPSARRATSSCGASASPTRISIHALREEGDSKNRDKISIFK